MRHNKAWLTIGMLSFALLAVGCKQTEETKLSAKTAGHGGSPSQVSLTKKDASAADTSKSTSLNEETGERTISQKTEQAETCYQDLCKDMQKATYTEIYNRAANPVGTQKEYYKTNFEGLVKTYVNSMMASRQTWSSLVQKHENDLGSITLNDTQLSLVKAVYIYAFDELLPMNLQNKIYAKVRTQLFFKANLQTIMGRSNEALHILYPDQDFKKAIKAEANHLNALRDKLKTFIGFNFMTVDLDALKRALNEEELQNVEVKDLLSKTYMLRSLDFFAFGEGKETAQDLILNEAMMTDLYEKSTLRKVVHSTTTVDKEIGFCEGRFYQGLNLYPDDDDIKKFKKLEPQIIKAVVELVPNNDKAQAALKNVKISYPLNVDQIVAQWQQGLLKGNQDEIDQAADLKKLDAASIKTMILIKAATMKRETSVCDSLIPTDIGDMNLRGTSQLNVSWFTIRIPHYGVGVLAHELAHIVHDSTDTMNSLKDCVKHRQPDIVKKSVELSAGNQSEDFADNISAKVMKKLSGQLDFKLLNYGCFFASAEDPKTRSLINPRTYDTHSSGLFRALVIADGLGEKIPTSCEQLAQTEESKVLNRCE